MRSTAQPAQQGFPLLPVVGRLSRGELEDTKPLLFRHAVVHGCEPDLAVYQVAQAVEFFDEAFGSADVDGGRQHGDYQALPEFHESGESLAADPSRGGAD